MISNVRNMETSGQVMGLKETKDGTTLLATSDSNNIDVHLQKNTEYGAMILLAASPEYGKQGTGTARYVGSGTTTGNVYGVYMNDQSIYYEWVAAGVGTGNSGSYNFNTGINSKYVNRYSSESARFNGDAMLTWHNNSTISPSTNYAMIRGCASGVFYCHYAYGYDSWYGRAVVVCGQGF